MTMQPTITPKEFREMWVERLESGHYPQTRGALRTTRTAGPDAFCCLGIASSLFAKYVDASFEWNPRGTRPNVTVNFGKEGNCSTSYPPQELVDFIGAKCNVFYAESDSASVEKIISILKREEPVLGESKAHWLRKESLLTLSCLNDEGFSFTTIAALIREVPEAFFEDAR